MLFGVVGVVWNDGVEHGEIGEGDVEGIHGVAVVVESVDADDGPDAVVHFSTSLVAFVRLMPDREVVSAKKSASSISAKSLPKADSSSCGV